MTKNLNNLELAVTKFLHADGIGQTRQDDVQQAMTDTSDPTRPAFVPTPQPTLVAYLEQLLERARAGEVQFFVCSAGVTPEAEPTGFDVKVHVAMGDRVVRYAPAARRAVYASVLEGLQKGAMSLDQNFGRITPDLPMPE